VTSLWQLVLIALWLANWATEVEGEGATLDSLHGNCPAQTTEFDQTFYVYSNN